MFSFLSFLKSSLFFLKKKRKTDLYPQFNNFWEQNITDAGYSRFATWSLMSDFGQGLIFNKRLIMGVRWREKRWLKPSYFQFPLSLRTSFLKPGQQTCLQALNEKPTLSQSIAIDRSNPTLKLVDLGIFGVINIQCRFILSHILSEKQKNKTSFEKKATIFCAVTWNI